MRLYNCQKCSQMEKARRRCEQPGFENWERPRAMEDGCLKQRFCPGKATWYPEIIQLYDECRVAMQTGLLPKDGGLESQSEEFSEVFGFFVEHWEGRRYQSVWTDVSSFAKDVLETFLKSLGKMFGGK